MFPRAETSADVGGTNSRLLYLEGGAERGSYERKEKDDERGLRISNKKHNLTRNK